MLTLIVKKKWFNMILSGEKTEEYREIKPYYTTRFLHAGLLKNWAEPPNTPQKRIVPYYRTWSLFVWVFYEVPTIEALCEIQNTHKGRPEWGAEPGKNTMF